MRFVGGRISKNEDAVAIKTPAGSLSIRGCILMLEVKNPTNFTALLVYGDEMKWKGVSGQQLVVFQPGNDVFGQNGGSKIGPATSGDINKMMAELTNSSTSANLGGTISPANPAPKQAQILWNAINVQDLVSYATADQIQGELLKQADNTSGPTTPENNPPSLDNNPPSPVDTNNPPPLDNNPPPPVDTGGNNPPPPDNNPPPPVDTGGNNPPLRLTPEEMIGRHRTTTHRRTTIRPRHHRLR
jgi:hypothetical protein